MVVTSIRLNRNELISFFNLYILFDYWNWHNFFFSLIHIYVVIFYLHSDIFSFINFYRDILYVIDLLHCLNFSRVYPKQFVPFIILIHFTVAYALLTKRSLNIRRDRFEWRERTADVGRFAETIFVLGDGWWCANRWWTVAVERGVVTRRVVGGSAVLWRGFYQDCFFFSNARHG